MEFPPFRLDVEEERLWNGERLLALRRKPFAILRYLATHPQRLVTHAELLENVWGGTSVSESSIRSHLHELRQVLGDGVIETVVGRGYRFIATIAGTAIAASAKRRDERRGIVGRVTELATLHRALETASQGKRQVCFVTGEPGIGKTTLVDAFVDEAEDRGYLAVRGHCMEQHGTPEPYLAVIELVTSLVKSERGPQILATFVRRAPTFMAQLPHLVSDEQLADVTRRSGGSSARMVREIVDALEHVAEQPLVVVLEDLQWSDLATLDFLSILGQRKDRAKLLVIATSRRAEVHDGAHALSHVMRTLVSRWGAIAIGLEEMSADDMQQLLDARFAGHAFPPMLTEAIVNITGGTPLFAATLLEDVVGRGMIIDDGRWKLAVPIEAITAHRPDSLRQLIDIQLDRLEVPVQRVLEAGALVGLDLATPLVAAALELDVESVDEVFDGLTRRMLFVRRIASETEPDGSLSSRYCFVHGLVREVCLARTPEGKRQRWHRSIAAALERSHAGHTDEIAHVLALHHDRSQNAPRAIEHYLVAAKRSAMRLADRDALAAYARALELLRRLPASSERDARELEILMISGQIAIRTSQDGHDEGTQPFERCVELARNAADVPTLYAAIANLCMRHLTQAQYKLASPLADELEALASQHSLPPALADYGVNLRATLATYLGELSSATTLFESLLVPMPGDADGPILPSALHGPRMANAVVSSYLGALRWTRGYSERALQHSLLAVDLVRGLGDPLAFGLLALALLRVRFVRRDPLPVIDELLREIEAFDDIVIAFEASVFRAWISAHERPTLREDGVALVDALRARLAAYPGNSIVIGLPVVDLLRRSGHDDLARSALDAVLGHADRTGEALLLAELLILRGDLENDPDAYRAAQALARKQGARAFELRATTRLARHGATTDLATLVAEHPEPSRDLDDARALLAR